MKFCQNCGSKLEDSATFCSSCGTKQINQANDGDKNLNPANHQNNYQRRHTQTRTTQSVKEEKGPNPIEQGIINFLNKYCSPQTLTLSIVLASIALAVYIFYVGELFNFSGPLLDITYKLQEIIPLWALAGFTELVLLYLLMHLFNALYKAGAKWPLLYITPCLWGLAIMLNVILSATEILSQDDLKTLNILFFASYVCVGIIGVLCSKIRMFSWTGKVMIVAAIFWTVALLSSSISLITFILTLLAQIWLIYEVGTRVNQFFNEYDSESFESFSEEGNSYFNA